MKDKDEREIEKWLPRFLRDLSKDVENCEDFLAASTDTPVEWLSYAAAYIEELQSEIAKVKDLLEDSDEVLTIAFMRGMYDARDEIERLRKDKGRIDYLSHPDIGAHTFNDQDGRLVYCVMRDHSSGRGPNIREAIDAAMKGGSDDE